MPTITNSRNHMIILEGVRLAPGQNEVTDEQWDRLKDSGAFKKHQRRGWAGVARQDTATATGLPTPNTQTNPALPDGSPLRPGTKPEEAPLDFPEANEQSKRKAEDEAKRTRR